MSYQLCRKCGSRHEIFAHGGGARLAESLGVPFLGELPVLGSVAKLVEKVKRRQDPAS